MRFSDVHWKIFNKQVLQATA